MLRYNQWPTRTVTTQQDLMIKSQLLGTNYKYFVALVLIEYFIHVNIRIFIDSIIYKNSNYIKLIIIYLIISKMKDRMIFMVLNDRSIDDIAISHFFMNMKYIMYLSLFLFIILTLSLLIKFILYNY
jgi:hypothetical protein